MCPTIAILIRKLNPRLWCHPTEIGNTVHFMVYLLNKIMVKRPILTILTTPHTQTTSCYKLVKGVQVDVNNSNMSGKIIIITKLRLMNSTILHYFAAVSHNDWPYLYITNHYCLAITIQHVLSFWVSIENHCHPSLSVRQGAKHALCNFKYILCN